MGPNYWAPSRLELIDVLKSGLYDLGTRADAQAERCFSFPFFSDVRKLKSRRRLHKAVEALRPKVPTVLDPSTAFWNAYKNVADEYDKEFKEKYGTDLDTSLIFVRYPYLMDGTI